MPKSPKQKQKLLYIIDYLMEHTDETHTVTTPQIIEHLERNDISAERKSIYDDIQTLQDYGYDIIREAGPKGGYKLASRDFELAEVKLMVDLVQSSKFITEKKSQELIAKLERLASKNDAAKMQRSVYVADRVKASNEYIYYSVDVMHTAMAMNQKVSYQYFSWDEKKNMVPRKNGEFYEVSPWMLTWAGENYYLVAYDEADQKIKYYRVDKMMHIKSINKPRQGKEAFEKIDVAAMTKETFGMYSGRRETITFSAEKSMANVLIDRFGTDLYIRADGDDKVFAKADIQVSPQFFGWLAGLGGHVKVQSPESVAAEYKDYLQKLLKTL